MISSILKQVFDASACRPHRQTFYRVLLARPLVIYLQGSVKHCVYLHRRLAGTPAWILRGGIGCEEHPSYARRWANYQRAARKYYPEHEVILLANTKNTERNLLAQGAQVHFCSQNGLLDERLFAPCPDVVHSFDAVLNSQMEAVKRHWLAASVKSLAVITYRLDAEPKYYTRIRNELAHAAWLNFESGNYSSIAPVGMSRALSRAKVGLILSAAEGANYATVEYLLTGLPVLSTPSLGGRDVFYDERCVSVVADNPADVAKGVHELAGRNLRPEFVRSCVLPMVLEHRRRFVAIVQGICDRAGVKRDLVGRWDDWFVNKMLTYQPMSKLDDEIAGAESREGRLSRS